MYQAITYNVITKLNEYEYYDFLENGYKLYFDDDVILKNNQFISITNNTINSANFFYWKDVDIIKEEINDNEYILLKIKYWEYFYSGLYCKKEKLELFIKKAEAEEIINLYLMRNEKMHNEKKCIGIKLLNINQKILDISQNLLNISEEKNIMLNYKIVAICHSKYSHIIKKYKDQKDYEKFYPIYEYTYDCKGKEKKEIEKNNIMLDNAFEKFTELIDNFVEIIIDEEDVSLYIARSIAWYTIQQKSIDYYANEWKNKYDIYMNKSYNYFYLNYKNEDINIIVYEYLKNILLYNEIDLDSIAEILMYFLLSMKSKKNIILYNEFVDFYELIKKIKKEVKSMKIKQKLKTQKIRKIMKYTIDDIDLMSGIEFENFIALIFKKLGYLTQITNTSGDQGIDIIAIKNNLRIGIQAKCYNSHVGNSAIQEVVAGKKYYNCQKVIVVTNNYFTNHALDLAKSNDVILWDRNILKEKIIELF